MTVKKPKVPDLKDKYFLMLKDELLRINDLKIGDTILWNFRFDTLRSKYKGGMECYSANEESEGVLMESEKGYLFVESIKEYSFYFHKWNQRTGRQSRYTWVKTMKKATHYFGSGFIHIK